MIQSETKTRVGPAPAKAPAAPKTSGIAPPRKPPGVPMTSGEPPLPGDEESLFPDGHSREVGGASMLAPEPANDPGVKTRELTAKDIASAGKDGLAVIDPVTGIWTQIPKDDLKKKKYLLPVQ
jgi:hypothetical protein